MCYDVAYGKKKAVQYAKRRGEDPDVIRKLEQELALWVNGPESHFYISGFAHPKLLVFTNDQPHDAQFFHWGLIPPWVQHQEQAHTLQNQTLNARAETLFDKPSFKEAAKERHCLIFIDGFYEHHHRKGKTYPYFITMKDDTPMCLAGLWETWLNKQTGELHHTVTIVTTMANSRMAEIHNNPKLTEPRMPVILNPQQQELWLNPIHSDKDKQGLLELFKPIASEELHYHTVHKLKGKNALGDVAEVQHECRYKELEVNPPNTLF